MLHLTRQSIERAYEKLEKLAKDHPLEKEIIDHLQGEYSRHDEALVFTRKSYCETISLRVAPVICCEPFADALIPLCFLEHGWETAVEAIESLGITVE